MNLKHRKKKPKLNIFFEGSNFVEIFNPNIKDPLTQFKITGPNGIQKVIDWEKKGRKVYEY